MNNNFWLRFKIKRLHNLIFLLGIILCIPSIVLGKDTEIKGLRIWPSPESTRVVLDLNGPVEYEQKEEKGAEGQRRIILLIKQSCLKTDLSLCKLKNTRIKHIKSSCQDKTLLKLVLELEKPLKPTSFTLPPNQEYGHRLVIDLEDEAAEAAEEQAALADRGGIELNSKIENVGAAIAKANARANTHVKTQVDSQANAKVNAEARTNAMVKNDRPEKTVAAKIAMPAKTVAEAQTSTIAQKDKKAGTPSISALSEKEAIIAIFTEDSESTHERGDSPHSPSTPSSSSDIAINAKPPINQSNQSQTIAPMDEPNPQPTKTLSQQKKIFIVAIDAGHGGEDPGAIGCNGTREKDVVLAISQQLKGMIDHEPGMKAVLIRSGDYYVGLKDRMSRARKHKADLFVSVHADAFSDRRAEGASVFTLSENGASSTAAKWIADRENRSDLIGGVKLSNKNKMLASVLLDLTQSASKEEGLKAAQQVLSSLGKVGSLHRGQVEQAGFAVLKAPDVPSMLVETGFISHPPTERKLKTAAYQKKIAAAIMGGIRQYASKRSH